MFVLVAKWEKVAKFPLDYLNKTSTIPLEKIHCDLWGLPQ